MGTRISQALRLWQSPQRALARLRQAVRGHHRDTPDPEPYAHLLAALCASLRAQEESVSGIPGENWNTLVEAS